MEIILLLWMACGVVCYFIVKSKGYPNDSCLKHGVLGFFLGFIWIIVVLTKKENPDQIGDVHRQPPDAPQGYSAPQSNSTSAIEELRRLFELKQSGAITEAEYERKKQELLRR